jgi:hypothetical protein
MQYFFVLAQFAVAAVLFLAPGGLILGRLRRAGSPASPVPPAQGAAAAFLISSLLVGVVTLLLAHLPPPLARAGARAGALLLAGAAAWRLRAAGVPAVRARLGAHLPAVAAIGGVLLVWCVLLPRSPYPSQLAAGLGDTVNYYRVAANLAGGRGLTVDYFTGDYAGGVASYTTGQPLLSLAGAALFLVCGVNNFAVHTYALLAAGLLVALWGSLVAAAFPARQGRPAWAEGAACAVFALVPAHFLLLGLGVHTVPGALAFLLLAAPALGPDLPAGWRRATAALAVAYLAAVRPEAALAALAWAAASAGHAALAGARRRGARHAWAAVAALLLLLAAGWASLPPLLSRLPASLQNMTFNFVSYDRVGDTFAPIYSPWWSLNQELCRVNFNPGGGSRPPVNAALGEEIRRHPAAFARYLLSGTAQLAGVLRNGLLDAGEPTARTPTGAGLLFLLAVLLPALAWPPARRVGWAVALLFAVLPLFNSDVSFRHLFVVWPALTAAAAAGLLALLRARLPVRPAPGARRAAVLLGAGAALAAAVFGARHLAGVRSDPRNLTYLPIIEDLRALAQPGDLVAASYPALIGFALDRRAVGGTWLTENLEGLVGRFAPDLILFDRAREGPDNYGELFLRPTPALAAYAVAVHRPEAGYAIFRRK